MLAVGLVTTFIAQSIRTLHTANLKTDSRSPQNYHDVQLLAQSGFFCNPEIFQLIPAFVRLGEFPLVFSQNR